MLLLLNAAINLVYSKRPFARMTKENEIHFTVNYPTSGDARLPCDAAISGDKRRVVTSLSVR